MPNENTNLRRIDLTKNTTLLDLAKKSRSEHAQAIRKIAINRIKEDKELDYPEKTRYKVNTIQIISQET